MSSSCASSWTPVARTTHPSMDFCGWPYPSSLLVSLRRSYRSFRECLTSASMMSAFSKPRPWWRRRHARARARIYICVSSKSFHFEERERERQKCVPNRSSFLLRVIKGVFCVLLLLLLLFARILLRLKSRRLSRRLRRRTFCRLFPSVRPRSSSSKLVLVSMWRLCLSIYTGRSCCLCRSSLSSSSSSSSSSSFSLSSRF